MPFIGKQPEVGAYQLIDSITTSATATFALAVDGTAYFPASARNLIVSLNGVTQAPESAYTVSGSNIVFDSALTTSDVIDYILVIGDAVDIGTPSDGTVGTAQISYPLGNFSSTGIDDNATSTAVTISSAENVGINNASPSELLSMIGTGGTAKVRFDGDSSNLQNNFIGITGYDDLIIASDEANSGTASTIQFRVDAGEKMRILSGGGITFNGDTAAANALDDYEEGSFTPTYSPATNSFGSISYSVQSGYYVKIGNMVHFSVRISLSGYSVGSAGNAYLLVSGLPYTAHNLAYSSVYVGYSYSFTTRWPTGGELGRGTNYSYLYAPDSTSDSSSVICSYVVGNGTHLFVSGSYYTF